MALDWNKLTETFLTNTGPILLALGAFFKVLQKNQKTIKRQLDGHTKMFAKAKKAEGKYEAVRESKKDLVDVVNTIAKQSTRTRRRTDK